MIVVLTRENVLITVHDLQLLNFKHFDRSSVNYFLNVFCGIILFRYLNNVRLDYDILKLIIIIIFDNRMITSGIYT